MQYASGIAAVACGGEAAQKHPAVTPTLTELLCPRAPTHLRGVAQRGASALGSVYSRTLADSPSPRQETESQGFKKQRQGQEKEGEEPGHSSSFQSGCMKNLPVKAGVRPRAPRQLVREYTYVYAAVAPAEGKMTSLILPSANTEMMGLFLSHVSSTYAKYFVVMQVDQASWHVTKDLKIPENIRLIAQPAYSPELNPVEHVWEELREKQLANLALPSLDDVIDKVCEGLNQLEADQERLRSLTYFPHFRMVS